MDEIALKVLSQLEPKGLEVEGQGWQQRKSVQTRITILEAAIDCLQRHGYARTTTQLIAEIAGISRGAMLHHYATKQDLIGAVIDYTLYKRMEVFLEGVRALKESDRIDAMSGVDLFWRSLLRREYQACLELAIAARTDAELARIFLPKVRRFDEKELEEVVRAFPEWAADPRGYALAMDYCNAAIQGLAINADVWLEDQQQALRDFVGATMSLLRQGEFGAPE